MNPIEPIRELPEWDWLPNSRYEIETTGADLIDASDFVYRVGKVVSVGFIYHSYTSPPWMWFAIAKNVGIADLIDFRRLTQMIPQGTLTAVAEDFPLALRFAKLYGFVDTEKEISHLDRVYKIMRKN